LQSIGGWGFQRPSSGISAAGAAYFDPGGVPF
jgi:hypothetical protein